MSEQERRLLREQGWDVTVVERDGVYWASLVAIENPGFVAADYGRGDRPDTAVTRAWERFVAEQRGAAPD